MSLLERPWEQFFNERIQHVCDTSSRILDIGASLRLSKEHGNRENSERRWILDRIRERRIEYVVLDYVDTYHPHIVGDLQNMPLPDSSEESIVCLAILEHVENPFKAVAELHRVLKSGGQCLLYVPFLYYYHAERGYYQDYWRFTRDSIEALAKPFATVEIQNVRGPLETLIRLSPLGRKKLPQHAGFIVDRMFGKLSSKQTSGYYVYCIK